LFQEAEKLKDKNIIKFDKVIRHKKDARDELIQFFPTGQEFVLYSSSDPIVDFIQFKKQIEELLLNRNL
jgi:hypothetical protein